MTSGWKESTFTTALKKSLLECPSVFFHKIMDMPHFAGTKSRFDSKKPFDVIMVHRGVPIALEIKTQKGLGAFSLKNRLAPHQIEALENFHNCGGKSYVILNQFRAAEKGVPRVNHFIFFRWSDIRERALAGGSIKAAELKEMTHYPGTGKGFQVDEFLADTLVQV